MSFRFDSLLPIAKGLSVTLREFFRQPVTIRYPEEKRPFSAIYRGAVGMRRRPDGRSKCVGCGLCETACPNECITITTESNPAQPTEKVVTSYTLDIGRCLFCGLCVEACPVEALEMTNAYNFSTDDRSTLIYDVDRLMDLVDKQGKEVSSLD